MTAIKTTAILLVHSFSLPLSAADHDVFEHMSFPVLIAVAAIEFVLLLLVVIQYMKRRNNAGFSFGQIKLENMMETASGAAIAAVDRDGHIIKINSAFRRMLGYLPDEVKGKSVFVFLFEISGIESLRRACSDAEEGSAADRDLLAFMACCGSGEWELSFFRKNGISLPVNATVHIINDNRGGEAGFLIVAADLTEKHRFQRELEESQKFLRSVIDAIPTRIFWKDTKCVYLGCNNAFAKDCGFENPDEVVGLTDTELPWGDEFAESYGKDDRFVLSTKSSKLNFDESVVVKDGRLLTIRTSKMPLLDVNNDLIGVLGMYEDVTDYKRMQEIVEKRIVALTRFMDNPDELEFDKLFDINEIQRIQDEFSESTGVSSVIVGNDGRFITKASRMSSLCKLVMNLQGEICARCFDLTRGLTGIGVDSPAFRQCEGSGLSMAVSPIIAGGVHVASWILGQVKIDIKDKVDLAKRAANAEVDPVAYCKAYDAVPCMTKERFDSVVETAHTLCTQLSLFATQNIQQARLLKEEKERIVELRRYRTIIQQIPDGVITIGRDLTIQYANPAFSEITGYSQEEALGKSPMMLSSDRNSDDLLDSIVRSISAGKVWSGRMNNKRKDGTLYTEESVISPVFDDSGEISSCVATMRDISGEIAREEEMYHRQKMAAVGQLAGGVAHDFNNILQAVLGFSEILMQQLEPASLEYSNAEQICRAAKRAAALTRGLLALGRKEQTKESVQSVDLNFMLHDSFVLLNLLSTEKIEIVYELEPNLRRVSFSNEKFYQVIVNLVVNARDAMPDGGSITVRTENISEANLNPKHFEPDGCDYVRLTVADMGCGIPEVLQDRIFDPFYTTKDVGKGSGLGLAIIYVIIADCSGKICFETKIGEGTRFFVYLPIEKV